MHWDTTARDYLPSGREKVNGPDRKGEDVLIKTPHQLVACLIQVAQMLSSLQRLQWKSLIFPMPEGVFSALEKLTSLSSLYIDMSNVRTNVYAREYLCIVSFVSSLCADHVLIAMTQCPTGSSSETSSRSLSVESYRMSCSASAWQMKHMSYLHMFQRSSDSRRS